MSDENNENEVQQVETSDLVRNVVDKTPSEFASTFDALLKDRIAQKVADKKLELSQSLFGAPETGESDEEIEAVDDDSVASDDTDETEEASDEETTEEETEINELSRGTVHRYAVKSAEHQVDLNDKAIMVGNSGKPSAARDAKLDPLEKTFNKRDRGLKLANKRLPGGKVYPNF